MKIISATNPKWADDAHSAITLDATFEGIGTIQFAATASDVESHGRAMFAQAASGNFGAIAAKPATPLVEVKHTKRAAIIAARNAAITGGFTYMSKPIDSDRDSVMAITGAAVAALAAKASALPYSVTWTCADDSTLTLDADGVLGMAVTLAQYADAQHTKGRPLKAQAEAAYLAGNRAALEAVAW